ncbi:MAG: flagellar biosynthesis protein FlhA [Proteobacteria bacterium]|nr:flagellar biosynthesis protein FlhA [Pseudomonadota bacterium]
MTDAATSGTTEEAAGAAPRSANPLGPLFRGDIALALGVVGILLMLIMPLAPWLLDIMLAASITFSVLILMTALFIEKPLEFSAFPTVLLIATMLRLSLNLASTRLILADGHTGPDAAGQVIQAFGGFLMGETVIIGMIVFAILIIVNFVVITKGSGRIAEVAARFSLDAMPGKQMAIDADLSAGLIDEASARSRRKELEEESSFFGSMDGAAKFVRGDAIAGLLITFINIIGGIVVGVATQDMAFGDAFDRYTALTIGDGLVTQIPALIVSTSAGLVVTKAGIKGRTDKVLFGQLSNYPRAMVVSSVLLIMLGLMPGLPALPFFMMGGALGYGGYNIARRRVQDTEVKQIEKQEADQKAVPEEDPISTALAIDPVRLELGYGLLALINDQSGYRLTDQIKALRRQLAGEMGFVMPSVRILDNMQLPANTYALRLKETEVGRGDIRPGMLLVMDPRGEPVTLSGESTTEPAFGLPATWVDPSQREEASFRGYTVVDAATVVTTHLTEVIKDNMSELLSYAETQKLLDDLPPEHQKLLADMVPANISHSGIQRVLQNLLSEMVSIRDLPAILEGISEATGYTQNILGITEHVRGRLSRQISSANTNADGFIPLVTMSPEWEKEFAESIVGQGDDKQLAMAPSKLQDFIAKVRITFEQHAAKSEVPVLLASPAARPFVRSIVERVRPATVVMSQSEIHPKAKIRTLGQI